MCPFLCRSAPTQAKAAGVAALASAIPTLQAAMDLANADKWRGWVAAPHCEAAFDPAGRHNPFHELLVTQVSPHPYPHPSPLTCSLGRSELQVMPFNTECRSLCGSARTRDRAKLAFLPNGAKRS
jgi:hypothetical protein